MSTFQSPPIYIFFHIWHILGPVTLQQILLFLCPYPSRKESLNLEAKRTRKKEISWPFCAIGWVPLRQTRSESVKDPLVFKLKPHLAALRFGNLEELTKIKDCRIQPSLRHIVKWLCLPLQDSNQLSLEKNGNIDLISTCRAFLFGSAWFSAPLLKTNIISCSRRTKFNGLMMHLFD